MIERLYKLLGDSFIVTTDSRNISKDSVFFALRGERFDGNKFVISALNQGARFAVIDNKEFFINNEKTVLVDNTLIALQKLASYHRRQFNIPVIGITGTNGKTTTKELIGRVLGKRYNTVATQGNLNNHIGVPLTLFNISKNTEIAIIEMGANHSGEIDSLCKIADPEYGVITNIGKAHLEGFGSFEGVIKTKMELFKYIERNGNTFFLNRDDPELSKIKYNNIITYSINNEADISGQLISQTPCLEVSWKSKRTDKSQIIKTHIPGSHNLMNILCAISIAEYFEVSVEDINDAIGSYIPNNNRSQIIEKENTIFLDAYNANPTSVMSALNTLVKMRSKREVYFILGDMLELGKYSLEEHRKIIDFVDDKNIRGCFVGNNFYELKDNYIQFSFYRDTNHFIQAFNSDSLKDIFVLIKGSRGIGLEKILSIIP